MAQWGVTTGIPDAPPDFQAAAPEEHPTWKLNWKTDSPVSVEQLPLSKEKLKALQELVDEQLAKGRIVETMSLWNSPVFVIKKANKGKWWLLHNLHQINNVIEDMGSLQPGMPSLMMLPQNWNLAIIDIKDCFFQILLHPDDDPRFAFLVPTLNREAPRKRYRWKCLPQGMKNSPSICQWYLSSLLSPVHTAVEAIILHYMDDVLVCAPNDDLLSHMLDLTINSLVAAGFELQEEKIQRMQPWNYLGLEIDKGTIVSQKLIVKNNIKTLADVQQLCGSLKWDFRGLRKDYTRRPDESIISWLVHLWDAAGEATMLDGTEARHLGSLSHDPVIDQEMMREASPCSLWKWVLGSVAQRYLCADDLYMQQTQWKTIEQGIQRLREMAVAEIVFSGDINTRNPDLVPCTPVMWQKLVRLGPQEYSSALAIMKRDETEETVLDMAKKLQTYADAVHGPTRARIAALEMRIRKLEDKIEENHKELKQDILQISAVQVRGSGTTRKRSLDREGKGIPRAKLWSFLRDCGENMKRWDGESTDAMTQRLHELLDGKTVEARENRVFWTVWIRWPGTSEPQKYEALVDSGAQCTLLPSRHVGEESVSITGVTGGSQDFTLVEGDVSLTGNEWKRHPIVTGPEAPCILGIDLLRNGYFKDPKGFRWAFGIAAVETEGVKQLNTLPGLSENPSAVGLLKVEEQQVPIATSIVHRRQYRTTRDAVIPIHKIIRELETQGVVSKPHSPFNRPIWPVCKSDGEWRLTVDYRALNEVTPPLSAAVPDMLELQYELESKAAKWYATIDIANAFFSIPLAAECRPQFAFTWRGVQYTWNRLPQGWKHSPTICHGLIQAALEKGEAPEHLQYIDDIIVWGNTAMEVFEKGEKIIQILLKAGFAIKKSKVKGPA
ncbi:hypothetical protein DUI87_25703 [Hirundo rustica rustica]|uniref:ribonuclease H n=1 Tax=Hirundo rustica rustica TaxID=333673 RepID=A0A3M0JSL0_HIRRU|nr:hypothetical protein DUI87_25703 [Hirundo rustica rustica]